MKATKQFVAFLFIVSEANFMKYNLFGRERPLRPTIWIVAVLSSFALME